MLSLDPLSHAGTEIFAETEDGLAFHLDFRTPGAWEATLDIEYSCKPGMGPTYLTWLFEVDELTHPFGSLRNSLSLSPGRRVYSIYLPLRAGLNHGKCFLETSEGRDWRLRPASAPLVVGSARQRLSDVSVILHGISFTRPGVTTALPPNCILLPVTSYCNYKCVMCEHGVGAVSARAHFPQPLAELMVAQLSAAVRSCHVELTGLGEPFLSPMLDRIVDSVRNPLVRFRVGSNGALLTRERIDWILSSPFSDLNVSLDAASAQTYRRIRRANWDPVIRNLEAFSEALARSDRRDLRLVLNMTLMRENIGEVQAFVRLAKHLGATAYVNQLNALAHLEGRSVVYPDFQFNYGEQILCAGDPGVGEQLAGAVSLARGIGVPFLVEEVMRPLLDRGTRAIASAEPELVAPISQCPFAWVGDADGTAVISAQGDLQICCLSSPIGRVDETTTLMQAWNGESARRVREDIRAGRIPKPCSGANCVFVARQRAYELSERPARNGSDE